MTVHTYRILNSIMDTELVHFNDQRGRTADEVASALLFLAEYPELLPVEG